MATQSKINYGGILRPQGQLDVSNALQPYRGALNERSAAHLLRRAGFGGSPDEIRRYASMSVGSAVESLFRFPQLESIPGPGELYDSIPDVLQIGQHGEKGSPERKAYSHEIAVHKVQSFNKLANWWLDRMLTGPAPLQEKMAFYFHGHFTSRAIQKAVNARMMLNQNILFRKYALGNLRDLTKQVSVDPAMMQYLDNATNVKEHPNENYARELMELFTLGIGHYTEQDVRESARAWTGYHYNVRTEILRYDASLHDDGSKTFLGKTGNFNGDDIVDIIFEQPQCARFLAGSLLSFFVYNDPEPELVDAAADILRKHNYELAPLMSAILSSNVFYSERAYRSLVKSPTEFVVGTYKALGLTQVDERTPSLLKRMGQELFYPPTVAGWPGGLNWLSSTTMVSRQNFLSTLLNAQTASSSPLISSLPPHPDTATHTLVSALLQDDLSPTSRSEILAYLAGSDPSAMTSLNAENLAQRISGAAYIALAAPAYQLN